MGGAKKIRCPICEEKFDLDPELVIGDILSCPSCYIDLKIITLSPLKVEEVKEFVEDFEKGEGCEKGLDDFEEESEEESEEEYGDNYDDHRDMDN